MYVLCILNNSYACVLYPRETSYEKWSERVLYGLLCKFRLQRNNYIIDINEIHYVLLHVCSLIKSYVF